MILAQNGRRSFRSASTLQARFFGGIYRVGGGVYGVPVDTSEMPYIDHEDEPDFPRKGKMVVFGGTGFVGQEICRTMAQRGYDVISVSRSGKQPAYTTPNYTRFRAPNEHNYSWAPKVQWVEGDVSKPETYQHLLKTDNVDMPFKGVVSCVGGFTRRSNAVNVKLVDACAEANVPRFCYISAAHYPIFKQLLYGYYKGKMETEKAVMEKFPDNGVVLRAPMVHGTRWLFNTVPFTMWFIALVPRLLANWARWKYPRMMGMDKIFIKPIHSEQLASSASNFLERPIVKFKGIVEDYDDLRKLGRSFTDFYRCEPPWCMTR